MVLASVTERIYVDNKRGMNQEEGGLPNIFGKTEDYQPPSRTNHTDRTFFVCFPPFVFT